MPITLAPFSRRRFLRGSAAAGAALLLPSWLRGADLPADANRFALLSDIHVHADKAYSKSSTVPFETLGQAVTEMLAGKTRPAAVLVNGDLAAHEGTPADYATVIEGLAPLRKAGLPIHLGMGNHDHRGNFWAALPADEARQKALEDRQVCLIESARANIIMMDSLDVTARTPGVLGEKQLAWLAKTLDARADKPAIVFVHHDGDEKAGKPSLTDTKAFMEVIMPRKQVKAYVYGHTHSWGHVERDGVHFVNLPPTAWLFGKGKPQGWVDLTLAEGGATFELRSLNSAHPQHGEKAALKWR